MRWFRTSAISKFKWKIPIAHKIRCCGKFGWIVYVFVISTMCKWDNKQARAHGHIWGCRARHIRFFSMEINQCKQQRFRSSNDDDNAFKLIKCVCVSVWGVRAREWMKNDWPKCWSFRPLTQWMNRYYGKWSAKISIE